jgi:hypothetical protein
MKDLRNIITLLLLLVLTFSCTPKKSVKEYFDYGEVKEDIYTNEYFGLKMNIPFGWDVLSKEKVQTLTKMGKDLLAGDSEEMKTLVKASEISSANILMVYEYVVGIPREDFNANIVVVVENLMNYSGIRNGGDYLFYVRKLLMSQKTQVQYEYISTRFEEVDINGVGFYEMRAEIKFMEYNIKQAYYATLRNEFCLCVIISYDSEEQKSELMSSINSLTFNE